MSTALHSSHSHKHEILRSTNTKIVCTIGPSSESREVMRALIMAGMRIARLNFSHGSYEHHRILVENMRDVSEDLGIPCAIMQDLQGQKLRVGALAKPLELTRGEEVVMVPEEDIDKALRKYDVIGKLIPLQCDFRQSVKPGDTILIDDGLVELTVRRVNEDMIRAEVKVGGPVGSHKGINVPGRDIGGETITEKDKKDAAFGVALGVDIVALSFVSKPEDIARLKDIIKREASPHASPPFVIAKIERGIALNRIDDIIEASDGIMVARGDLGLEIEASRVPLIQKEIIGKCMAHGKPVIVATQMLDSMMRNPRPTRAEASDVAGAVVDHADALMLSGETAFGKYPVPACVTMAKIIHEVEQSRYDDMPLSQNEKPADDEEALARAAWTLASEVSARLILVTTISGHTARSISRFRPPMPIVVTCDRAAIQRQLILSWGVIPFLLPKFRSIDSLITAAVLKAKESGLARSGDYIVLVSGQPVGHGGANLIKVHTI